MTSQDEEVTCENQTPPEASPYKDRATFIQSVSDTLMRAFPDEVVTALEARQLAQTAVQYRFAPSSFVLHPHTQSNALWLLQRGRVSLGHCDGAGGWRHTRSVGPGEWLDVASAWLGETHVEPAKATSPSTVLEFPIDQVQTLIASHPRLGSAFVQLLALRVRASTRAVARLAVKDLPARLACWLLDALHATGSSVSPIVLRQQKRALASELGASAETLSRALTRFKKLGYIEVRGYRVTVRDIEGLSREARRDQSS